LIQDSSSVNKKASHRLAFLFKQKNQNNEKKQKTKNKKKKISA